MREFLDILFTYEYSMLLLPTLALVVFTIGFGSRSKMQPTTRILLGLSGIVSALVLFNIALWTNPYGRQISSSIPAYGILPVLVALLVYCFHKGKEITNLWKDRPALLSAIGLLTFVLLGLVWLAESVSFYIIVGLSAVTSLGWFAGAQSKIGYTAGVTLLIIAWQILFAGSSFFSIDPDLPSWLRLGISIVTGISMLLAIFLCAALLYISLRNQPAVPTRTKAWRWALIALLACSSVIMVFWDGLYSSVHMRAYEDHLPFIQFLASLTAGAVLALILPGWRRLVGIAFCAAITTIAVIALNWGWNTSAVGLTQNRAARIEQAIIQYQIDHRTYPARLNEITPRYLLYLPPPLISRMGGWCYQGGADFFRLGYISGTFTYAAADLFIQTHAQAGKIPPGSWECDRLLKKVNSGDLIY